VRTLSERLTERGMPGVRAQLEHPTVAGIARGDLEPEAFRAWLEQDYLFLLDYVRVFSRLAWQAPDQHLGDLVDLAHSTWHDELDLHRRLAGDFGADLIGAVKGPACTAYTGFLLGAAADYGRGLAALLPCMWGYSTLGRLLAQRPAPADARYARWIETYADPGFAALADRCAAMLDDAHGERLVDEPTATAAFDEGMRHELAFWDAGPEGVATSEREGSQREPGATAAVRSEGRGPDSREERE
jgi:thiaminase (transcriptional activator TenA)